MIPVRSLEFSLDIPQEEPPMTTGILRDEWQLNTLGIRCSIDTDIRMFIFDNCYLLIPP